MLLTPTVGNSGVISFLLVIWIRPPIPSPPLHSVPEDSGNVCQNGAFCLMFGAHSLLTLSQSKEQYLSRQFIGSFKILRFFASFHFTQNQSRYWNGENSFPSLELTSLHLAARSFSAGVDYPVTDSRK